ncbi:MAG: PPE domain-containing protein, partial [Mycobacterium sp.]
MGVHPWPMIDPATSYLTMTTGPGAVPMQLYSEAMTTQGVTVDDVVLSSQANAAVTFTPGVFQGSGADAAQAALTTHNADSALLGEVAMMKAQLANAAGELHTLTVPRMVTHVQANANRAEYVFDNAINPSVLWTLTARLIELDLEYYGYMWPNNAQAGVGYGAGLD